MNLHPYELIIDSFAGGGGASTGIFLATGRHPDVAINHDPEAVAMHARNHPLTKHYCKSIYHIDPEDVVREHKRRIGLGWFSPDCTHHSKARAGVPKQKHIRDLAWVVVHWAERGVYKGQRPRILIIENVEEFLDWGPLLEDGQPDPARKGEEFQRWIKALRKLGYKVEWKIMAACDFGAPTTRKRLFIVARCDGMPIVWPEPTHGEDRAHPHRTAGECIDWSIPCPSIFERKRPLKENTMRRIAKGVQRYVIDAKQPFIVNITHQGSDRIEPLCEPLRTITAAKRGEKAVVSAHLTKFRTGSIGSGMDEPMHTITAGGKSARPAGAPHAMGLVCAHMAQHNGGFYDGAGRSVDEPLSTVTATGSQQGLVACHIAKLRGSNVGHGVDEPLHTISAGGTHHAECRAFLTKYYGTDQAPELRSPLHTITSKDRFGLNEAFFAQEPLTEAQLVKARKVADLMRAQGFWDEREIITVDIAGVTWVIFDIGMRMLRPRELYNAQGFPADYIIEFEYNGRMLTITAQVRMVGNSVSPPHAAAIIRAQLNIEDQRVAA